MLGLDPHARKRMRQRDITEAEIEEALSNKTSQYPSDHYPDDRIVVCGKTRNGRRLKVIVESADPEYVISVMDQDDDR